MNKDTLTNSDDQSSKPNESDITPDKDFLEGESIIRVAIMAEQLKALKKGDDRTADYLEDKY